MVKDVVGALLARTPRWLSSSGAIACEAESRRACNPVGCVDRACVLKSSSIGRAMAGPESPWENGRDIRSPVNARDCQKTGPSRCREALKILRHKRGLYSDESHTP